MAFLGDGLCVLCGYLFDETWSEYLIEKEEATREQQVEYIVSLKAKADTLEHIRASKVRIDEHLAVFDTYRDSERETPQCNFCEYFHSGGETICSENPGTRR
jgi:hypothetical protein